MTMSWTKYKKFRKPVCVEKTRWTNKFCAWNKKMIDENSENENGKMAKCWVILSYQFDDELPELY